MQKLFSSSRYGNLSSDFVMVVANLVQAQVQEEVVEKGSEKDK